MFGKKYICHDQEILDEEMQNESKYGMCLQKFMMSINDKEKSPR